MMRFVSVFLLVCGAVTSAGAMETLHTGAGAALTARDAPSERHPKSYRTALIVVPEAIEAPIVGFDYYRRFPMPANRGKVIVKVTIERDRDGDGALDGVERRTLRCAVAPTGGSVDPFCTEWVEGLDPVRAGDLVHLVFQFKGMPPSPTGGRVEFFGWLLDPHPAP